MMSGFFDVRKRVRLPENAGQSDGEVYSLQGWKRSGVFFWSRIKDLTTSQETPLRVLDIATGGGEVPIQLWQKAGKAGFPIVIDACDRNLLILEHARRRAEQLGASIRFFSWDPVSGPLLEKYDVVTCSFLMHHLDETQAIQVMQKMRQTAQQLVMVHDLHRGVLGLFLAYLGMELSPLTVRAAFTRAEVGQLALQAGLEGATMRSCWPSRWLLLWRRPEEVPVENLALQVASCG